MQINNSNEAQNNEARLVKILKELRLDAETDLSTAQARLKWGAEMDSLCDLVLNEKLNRQDYIDKGDSENLFWIGLQFTPFDFQKTGFTKFENFQGVIPDKYDVLIKDINNYYNVTGKLHNDIYANLRQQIKDRHDYLATTQSWYYLLRKGQHIDAMLDFYLNDPIYKNWVSQHQVDNINGKYGTVKMLQNQSIGLIFKITEVLGDNYHIDNPEVIEKLGTPRTDDLSEYVGTFFIENTNQKVEISATSGYLFANMQWHLKTIEKDSFTSVQYSDYRYSFKRNNKNKVIGVQMYHLKDSTKNKYWTKQVK